MKGKRNALVKVLLAVMLAICSLGFVACKKGDDTPSTSYGETGIYCFYAVEEEFQLTLKEGNSYTLTIEGATLEGKYAYDGIVLNLYADSEGGNIIGSISGTVLTLTYNGGTYSFYKKVDYTVSFNVDGGSAINAVTVVNGMTLAKPADPTKAGYQFVGWYKDQAFTTPFVFGADIITSNTTLYACFVAQSSADEFTATLFVDGQKLESKTTVGGVLLGLPTPESANKTFAGWWISDYQAADKLTYKYDGQTLTQNVNLYAVWAEDGVQVSVTSTGVVWSAIRIGVEYTVTIKNNGSVVSSPKTTTDLSLQYDFTKEIAGDYVITVEAEGKTATAYYLNKGLDRVSLFSVVNDALVFNAVENAEKYLVSVECGNDAHSHVDYDNGNSTSYNFAACVMAEDGIKFQVKAVAEGYITSVSDVYTYAPQLGKVNSFTFDENTGMLTWTAVENASYYEVKVTAGGLTQSYNLNTTSLSLTEYTGAITVTVKAVNEKYLSASAAQFTCTIDKLTAPVVEYVEGKIVWTAIEGAKSYVVNIDGTTFPVASGTEFALPAEYNQTGATYEISVKAVSQDGTRDSYYSQSIRVSYGAIQEIEYSLNNLRWGAVGGAYSYEVLLNDATVATLTSEARKAEIIFKKQGKNIITLNAYDQNGELLDSKSVEVQSFMVSFDVQGGSAVKLVYVAVGDTVKLSTPTKKWYEFAGWYTSVAGNGVEFTSDSVLETAGAMVLYANWTPVSFEVELKVGKMVYNDTTEEYEYVYVTYAIEEVQYNSPFQLSVPESDDVTLIFNGWYENDDTESTQYTDASGNSQFNWTKTSGYTLYAGWVSILNYELVEGKDGFSWHVTQGVGAKHAKEITVPARYTDPKSKKVYPVTHIETGAFAECGLLQTLYLPDTLQSIFLAFGSTTSGASTGSALYRCMSLKNIHVYCVDEDGLHDENSDHKTYYSSYDGMLIRHASPNTETLEYGTELAFVPYDRGTGTLVVPDGIEHIPTRTFYGLQHKRIEIPASVTRIGDRAFYGSAFEEIVFLEAPANVEEKPLILTEGVLHALFYVKEITIPTRIGNLDFNEWNMFTGDKNLMKINVAGRPTPEQKATNAYYTSVDGLVCNYDKTELVFVPKYISGTVTIPAEIKVIGENAFLNCYWNLESVVIKENVEKIESNAFLNCNTLSSVIFDYDGGSLEIESRAFYGCTNLYSIELPDELVYLGSHAFGNTTKLQTVTINGSNVATLEENAFAEDSGRYRGYVTTLNLGVNAPEFEINKVFAGCQLYVLNIDSANKNFNLDDEGVLYDSAKTKILYYPFGLTGNYEIPSTITDIGESVFENRANITSIHIPASVTSIGFNAFKNCVGLESLTFEDRTEDLQIAYNAFAGCIALTSVSLPEGITTLENGIFENCTNLTTLHIPSTLTSFLLSDAFRGCKKLATITVASDNEVYGLEGGILYEKSGDDLVYVLFVPDSLEGDVVIPTSVTFIDEGMFRGKAKITSISFENDETTDELVLGDAVFEGMSALTDVRLPDGLMAIPTNAFRGSSITSIYIPNTVETIMPGAFANCKNLTTVTFEEGSTKLTFAKATWNTGAFYNTPKLTSIDLPDRLKEISDYMFSNSSITEISFPAALETIGVGAFVNSKNLTTFNMPNTVTTVKSYAFSGCTALESVTLSSQLTELPDYLFAKGMLTQESEEGNGGGGSIIIPKSIVYPVQSRAKGEETETVKPEPVEACTALKSIVIPANVTTIGKYAFHGCSALATVTFASNSKLTTLSDYVFMETGLESFDMPDSVTSIGLYQFVGCAKLKSLTISDNVKTIPESMCDRVYTYEATNAAGVVYTETVETVPCSALSSIAIPNAVTSIGKNAFRDATALVEVTFGEAPLLSKIGSSAFENCAIKELDLAASQEMNIELGDWAFTGSALETVSLPIGVNNLGTAFLGCHNIKTFEIADDGDGLTDNNAFNVDAEHLVVYNKYMNEIKLYVGNAEEFVVPDSVTQICDNAFRGNKSLKKITFPVGLVEIGEAAFAFCSNLATVEYADLDKAVLKTIGFRAFAFSGLTEITIPKTVVQMGVRESYTLGIPVDVNEDDYLLSARVLDGWNVTSSSGRSDWAGRVFQDCYALKRATLHNSVLCEAMFFDCTALEEVSFGVNTNTFRGRTFMNCTSLKTIELPRNLSTVEEDEFTGSGLTEIYIPASLKFDYDFQTNRREGNSMFRDCLDLTKVTMDDSHTLIPARMFSNTGLKTFTLPKAIQTIEDGAFSNNSNLTEITFPAQLFGPLTIQSGAFSYCPNLSGGMDLSDDKITFSWVDHRGDSHVASDVFHNCSSLEWVKLPDNLTDLGNMFFAGCSSLRTVEVKNLKTLANLVFSGCHALENITLAADATEIGYSAFEDCYALKDFVIPDTVTILDIAAFKNSGIQSIVIGAGVTEIPENAFFGSHLKTVEIPANVTYINPSAFLACEYLESFSVDSANKDYKTGDYGELYDSTNILRFFPCASTAENGYFEMPTGTLLGEYAFYENNYITSIKVSAATSLIPTAAFARSNLASIELTSNVMRIAAFAFKDCVNLVEISLPATIVDPMEELENDLYIFNLLYPGKDPDKEVGYGKLMSYDENAGIGQGAFEGCTSLTTINIPKYMTRLAPRTFYGCTSLKTIELPYGLEMIGSEAFASSGLVEIVIPETVLMLGTLKETSGKELGVMEEIVSATFGWVFMDCTSLKSVVFQGIVDDVYVDAFVGCTALESVTLANGWTTITEGMFNGCTALNFEIPATVEMVEVNAFAGWTAEQTITINMSLEKANALWGEGWNGNAQVVVAND